jgi:hypothetical protein
MALASDFDPASPTALVLSYLKKQGLDPDAKNVRAALEQQARGGHALDSAQGSLTTEEPPAADQRNPSKTSKSVAGEIEGSGNKPIDSGSWDMPPGFAPTGSDNRSSSAQPEGAPDVSNIGKMIAMGAPALALGAGGSALWALNRPGVPAPGASVAPPPDVGAPPPVGDQYRVMPSEAAPVSPMDMAMARAVEPAGGVPRLGVDPGVAGANTVVDPLSLQPGVGRLDAINGRPNMPFRPNSAEFNAATAPAPPLLPPRGPAPPRMQDLPATPRGRLRLRVPG